MNPKILHTVNYGLFVVSTRLNEKKNGYIANTVMQLTANPVKFGVSCNKDNFTAGLILQNKKFSVSVLAKSCGRPIISKFGYKSGSKVEKFVDVQYFETENGTPVVTEKCVAWMEFELDEHYDVGSHYLFIGKLLNGDILSDEEPLTYSYYLDEYKGVAPKNAPTYISKELRKKYKL